MFLRPDCSRFSRVFHPQYGVHGAGERIVPLPAFEQHGVRCAGAELGGKPEARSESSHYASKPRLLPRTIGSRRPAGPDSSYTGQDIQYARAPHVVTSPQFQFRAPGPTGTQGKSHAPGASCPGSASSPACTRRTFGSAPGSPARKGGTSGPSGAPRCSNPTGSQSTGTGSHDTGCGCVRPAHS